MKKLQRWGVILFALVLIAALGYRGLKNVVFDATETVSTRQPVLAIVIDDFGGADNHGVAELLALNKPITVAVMPNLVHSVEQSKEAYKRGHEVILHQPMEPLRGKAYWLGPGAIKSSMSQEEIKKTFTENLKTVPHARGFNNHTGSKITSSKEKVTPMLEIAKSKGLYVLDSRTSQHSQIIPVARSMQVPWIKRDIFLDNIKSKGHIKKQIMKACEVAKKQGYAVAIGHVGQGGRVTASAVKEAIPLIEKEGVKLVPLSEIVKLKNGNGKV